MKKKMSDHGVTHVTPKDGNIFADLGFNSDAATALLVEADEEIAQRQVMRETLAETLITWMSEKKLKQEDAAAVLRISRPRVSDISRKKVERFSVDTLITLANRAGKKVKLEIA